METLDRARANLVGARVHAFVLACLTAGAMAGCGGGSSTSPPGDEIATGNDAGNASGRDGGNASGKDAGHSSGKDAGNSQKADLSTSVLDGSPNGVDAIMPTPDLATSDATPPTGSPQIAGCDIFPPDSPWNTDISKAQPHAMSATYLQNMAPTAKLHPDWGTFSEWYGIPYQSGTGAAPVKMDWIASWGPTESDPLACPNGGGMFCYPIPSTVNIEGGPSADPDDDRHVLYIDTAGAPSNCTLYELYNAQNWVGPDWSAGNGAIWHLGSNALRPAGWTSADAAGLPILPGLVRYDEVESGAIKHALRFTMQSIQQAYIHPATHAAGGKTNTDLPPMGLRLRLKKGTVVNKPSKEALVIITALENYGLLLADIGSNWYISGDTNDGWSSVIDGIISALNQLHGSDFEAVDTGPIAGH